MDTLTIKLAGTDYTIKPLTFRQMQDFAPACIGFYRGGGQLNTREAFDLAADVIIWALKAAYPDFARSTLDAMQLTAPELLDVVGELSFFSTLYKRTGPGTGEAKAGETISP